jgi:uncharacterized protein (TIGR02246 family)
MTDQEAIRNLITMWQEASRAGNLPALLELMTDDVVLLTSGQPPMNKEGFAKSFGAIIQTMDLTSQSDSREIIITGDYAYSWGHLSVTVTPKNSNESIHRSGYTLTVFRKEQGKWKLARDANMLVIERGI